nr:MAG TPA: hypothetical protein [Crassvirales sp.]
MNLYFISTKILNTKFNYSYITKGLIYYNITTKPVLYPTELREQKLLLFSRMVEVSKLKNKNIII